MPKLGLETSIVDNNVYENSVRRCREQGIRLPTFAQLASPARVPLETAARVAQVDPNASDPLNLFRIHWFNGEARHPVRVPEHVLLPESLTGIPSPILVLLGDRFPMIGAHKVLAAYGCLAPRLITGQFDPTRHLAVWPSTGNYCRGGVAVSSIMGCRSAAVLPEGMSRERFDWLSEWVADPQDIIRTPGTESNVKEIYDRCAELEQDPRNIIFNQFSEFGNYLAHYLCTGKAAERAFESVRTDDESLRLSAFVSATGSAGTLAAGDYLKERFGTRLVAVEALECPTMLCNGYGEHNIQGIGDKHIPLIHNVMNTDVVAGVSDWSTDSLLVLFNSAAGREYLARRRFVPAPILDSLPRMGLSSICNILAAIKTAKHFDMTERDIIVTVATDGAELYGSEMEKILTNRYRNEFGELEAAESFSEHMLGTDIDNLQELAWTDRKRIFNLGYFTWVEQQGVSIGDFSARRRREFWENLRQLPPIWDEMIEEFNARIEST